MYSLHVLVHIKFMIFFFSTKVFKNNYSQSFSRTSNLKKKDEYKSIQQIKYNINDIFTYIGKYVIFFRKTNIYK